MEVKFELHHRKRKDGTQLLYIVINPGRLRYPANISVDPNLWDKKNQKLKGKSDEAYHTNLKLKSILAKFNHIITKHYLQSNHMDAKRLLEEYKTEVMDIDFIVYMENKYPHFEKTYSYNSKKRDRSQIKKLKEFKPQLLFSELTVETLKEYKQWCRRRGNLDSTINGNISVIKKYILAAQKDGIRVRINVTDIKVGSMLGRRIPLTPNEVMLIYTKWRDGYCPKHCHFAVGLFLASCFTGLRYSDVIQFNFDHVINNEYHYYVAKTHKQKSVPLTKLAWSVLMNIDWTTKKSEQKLRKNMQAFCEQLGFNRTFGFHTARHTFATNFIHSGGNIEVLKEILGHANIRETMIYLNISKDFSRKEIDVFDDYMKQFQAAEQKF